MTIFTIDQDNNITAFASAKKADSNPETERFRSMKELAKVARKWPASRFIEIWNSLPGVSSVRKFTSRQVAIDRIWKAIQEPCPGARRTGAVCYDEARQGSEGYNPEFRCTCGQ